MPATGNHSFFDIQPLLPFIDDGYTVLTPNLRLARRVRQAWDQVQVTNGRQSWPTLPVQSLDNWLLGQWQQRVESGLLPPRKILSATQVNELWLQVIDSSDSAADTLNLLRPAAAASLAQQARDTLLRWQLDPHLSSNRQYFELDNDCGTFYQWLQLFERRLASAQLATPADCLAMLHGLGPVDARHDLLLVEVDDLSPLLQGTLAHHCKSLQTLHCEATPALPKVMAFADRRAELAAMASWAAERYRASTEQTVGLVLPDMEQDRIAIEHLLRREFDCLGSNYTSLPVNFSTAISLEQAPVVRDALRLLELATSQVALDSIVGLLQSRFVARLDTDSAALSCLVTSLFDIGQSHIKTSELRYQVTEKHSAGLEPLANLLMAYTTRRELRAKLMPSQWLAPLQDVLALAAWPGTQGLDSLEYQQVEQWHALLEDFADFDTVCGPMALAQAVTLIQRLSADRVSQPQTADSNIQVLGTLEAAGQQFDYLWVCGLQASSWPAAARPNPLIPLNLQRSYDMPHSSAEREWRFADRIIGSFRRTSGQFFTSYATQLDGVPELPSALLSEFDVQDSPATGALIDVHWTALHGQRDLVRIEDSRAPALEDSELETLEGGSGLLENQSQCPFRAFARHRLLVEPLSEPQASLSAAERGSILHEALFVLWGRLGGSDGLAALDDSAEQAACLQSSAEGLEKLPSGRRRQVGQACLDLEKVRLTGLLREWLHVERQRQEGFTVAAREEKMGVTLGRLTLRLQVDRVDTLADGGNVIIDYKSSASKVGDWLGRRPPKPQLLLYGLAVAEQPVALSFAQVRARESKFVGLGENAFAPGITTDVAKAVKGKLMADDWDSLNAVWRAQLEKLAEDFLAGEAAVDPLASDSCTWCGLQSLCRVDAGTTEEGAA